MDERSVEQSKTHPKKRIRLVIILFIAALLIFTLYSNTLLTMNLPQVWAEEGSMDPLIQSYDGTGVLQPLSEVEITNQAGWIVKDVKIKVGDRVTKGQTLVTYNNREAEHRKQDEQDNLTRQQLLMEGLQDQYIEAQQSGDEGRIRVTKRDMEIARLEMGVQERKLQNMKEELETLKQIAAPFNGVITQVGAVKGLPSGSAGLDIIISNASRGYQLSLDIPETFAGQLDIGSKLEVEVKSKGIGKSLEGHVTAIENVETVHSAAPDDGGGESNSPKRNDLKRVLILMQNTALQGGEQASVKLSKTSTVGEGVLLPTKAIHGEGSHKYIFIIEEKKGPLGNTYHARQVTIGVGDANDDAAIALTGAYPGQLIIIESSEPLQDGSRVRLR
ncbi:efflux RND transporter periplasmic adaptor subunit [Bacillus sp. FJAT-28004]|uniref:efflux RND transporter periplasmic adaptor subunit n=1 Tax=Bacillus sp. FJAT-28004 TaxID=1679165 RepID=UPI0006B419A5|nr:efflux RND transporter periplasmic adaptor subunit [Bacillus sp. FJAT-28004]